VQPCLGPRLAALSEGKLGAIDTCRIRTATKPSRVGANLYVPSVRRFHLYVFAYVFKNATTKVKLYTENNIEIILPGPQEESIVPRRMRMVNVLLKHIMLKGIRTRFPSWQPTLYHYITSPLIVGRSVCRPAVSRLRQILDLHKVSLYLREFVKRES
jgi:hypothetical protein